MGKGKTYIDIYRYKAPGPQVRGLCVYVLDSWVRGPHWTRSIIMDPYILKSSKGLNHRPHVFLQKETILNKIEFFSFRFAFKKAMRRIVLLLYACYPEPNST